jgi:hypothetical protein
MNQNAPFRQSDLEELDERMLARARAVVAMQEVHAGNRAHDVIGLRHDVDAGHALATAVKIAVWEAERGYRSTFYVLHTSPYWLSPGFRDSLERIAVCGHEIGIHTNALAESLRTGRDPDLILEEAVETLRSFGFQVRGVAGHGDSFCNRDRAEGEITFANDEQFVECARPQEGLPDRLITRGSIRRKLAPRPLADFGLDYEALVVGLPKPFRLSDSGGKWLNPGFDEAIARFELGLATGDEKQLHFLWHPDWWARAFAREEAVV